MSSDSRIVVGRPRDLGAAASVFAFGDTDDPARLVVLLADRVLSMCDPQSQAARSARECLAPRTPWSSRLTHLRSALHDVTDGCQAPVFALWDVDALAVKEREPYDSERTSLLRRDLFQLVREVVQDGGWILVRTATGAAGSLGTDDMDLDLERRSGDTESAPGAAPMPEEARLVAPECWPIATWLVANDVLRPRDLAAIKRTLEGRAEDRLIDLAYESLLDPARDSAALVTVLRAPQELNGHFGRLVFSPTAARASSSALPEVARTALVERGFLQPTWVGGPWRMPRLVRARLASLARFTVGDELHALHRLEAEAGVGPAIPAAASVEAHFHALCSGEPELAKRTAVYYGSELSEVARRLSFDAQQPEVSNSERKRLFFAAADLYEHIVVNFDDTDAFAWEYLGYNLACAESPDTAKIRRAYEQAHQHRPGNPLYHGRLLGFRGELGERIVDAAIEGIHTYALYYDALSYFAKAVMAGLWRGGRRDQAREIVERCGVLLKAVEGRVNVAWAQ